MKTIHLIHNEIHKNGKYKAIYFDTEGSNNNEGTFLKVIENGQMKLYKLSSEQIDKMYRTIHSFMGLVPSYKYRKYENSDTDNTLLVSIRDTEGATPFNDGRRYHNWQNSTPTPKGVDLLLKFLHDIIQLQKEE